MEKHLQLAFVLTLVTGTMGQPRFCHEVMEFCLTNGPWTRCFEDYMATCRNSQSRRPSNQVGIQHITILDLEATEELKENMSSGHSVHIPTDVLKRAGEMQPRIHNNIRVSVVVFNGSLFQTEERSSSDLLGRQVVGVKVGSMALFNLSQPVELTFRHSNKNLTGSCMFWEESRDNVETGRWSAQGCETKRMNDTFICSCNHLSFFAVLVNTGQVSDVQALSLSYITYIGCGLSVLCTLIAVLMHVCTRLSQKKVRDAHSMGVHTQLMGALLLLHLLFLLSAWLSGRVQGPGCLALGLLLHWALLATFTWTALESFHLYMLLVRVFNIYIRRYLLKLCLVGWGVPTITVAACALTLPYGIYDFQSENRSANSRTHTCICWITNVMVRNVTVTAYLGLVFLLGITMLGVVIIKLSRTNSKHTDDHQKKTLRRNCITLMGLSCVLGVPWGLAFLTYGPLSVFGLYFFTIANAFQGVFLFMWFSALVCKSRGTDESTITYQSTRKAELNCLTPTSGCSSTILDKLPQGGGHPLGKN